MTKRFSHGLLHGGFVCPPAARAFFELVGRTVLDLSLRVMTWTAAYGYGGEAHLVICFAVAFCGAELAPCVAQRAVVCILKDDQGVGTSSQRKEIFSQENVNASFSVFKSRLATTFTIVTISINVWPFCPMSFCCDAPWSGLYMRSHMSTHTGAERAHTHTHAHTP